LARIDSVHVGDPCWIDLATTDESAARAFYSGVLGWTAGEADASRGGYFMFLHDGVPIAGAMSIPRDDPMSDTWNLYLRSDDAAATVDASSRHGGSTLVPAMAVDGLGTMAMITDPGGATIGVWQPGSSHSFGAIAEPGAPQWFELHSRDYREAVDFYASVFGWTTSVMGDSDEFRYTVSQRDGANVAGVMDASGFLPEGVPSMWTVYFGVANADDALKAAASLGGTIVASAEDSPYGRVATVADPGGAVFRVMAT
jgi:uncharacterized protein